MAVLLRAQLPGVLFSSRFLSLGEVIDLLGDELAALALGSIRPGSEGWDRRASRLDGC